MEQTKICRKCRQIMVKLSDGTYDCGCPQEKDNLDLYNEHTLDVYPGLE